MIEDFKQRYVDITIIKMIVFLIFMQQMYNNSTYMYTILQEEKQTVNRSSAGKN